MTLIERLMVPCHRMIRTIKDDAFGSHDDDFSQGAPLLAFIRKDGSAEEPVAEKQELSERFTVVTYKTVRLALDDIIRRDGDGQVFRITGTDLDADAPEMSSVPITKVPAERWVIPT